MAKIIGISGLGGSFEMRTKKLERLGTAISNKYPQYEEEAREIQQGAAGMGLGDWLQMSLECTDDVPDAVVSRTPKESEVATFLDCQRAKVGLPLKLRAAKIPWLVMIGAAAVITGIVIFTKKK